MTTTKPDYDDTKGQIRVRSNVCLEFEAWHLVPGDLLRGYGRSEPPRGGTQHSEQMYYEPCSICKRKRFQFEEDGCDHPICRQSGKLPSTAEAARRKLAKDDSDAL
jgi:hypothetical protein